MYQAKSTRSPQIQNAIVFGICLCFVAAALYTARAATFTVTTTADSGAGSLR